MYSYIIGLLLYAGCGNIALCNCLFDCIDAVVLVLLCCSDYSITGSSTIFGHTGKISFIL